MSSHEDSFVEEMAIRHGAILFLQKPLTYSVIENLWQHARKTMKIKDEENSENNCSLGKRDSLNSSRNEEDNNMMGKIQTIEKVVWTNKLHAKFVAIVHQLGPGSMFI